MCAASALLGFTKDPMVAVALVLYVVALVKPVRVAVPALLAVEAVLAADGIVWTTLPPADRPWSVLSQVLGSGLVQLAAWMLGVASGRARAYTDGLREQAERRAETRLQQARRAVAEERLRVARELHDAVAHSMSVIAVQAGVGHYVIGTQPDEAARALAAIEATSRAVLQEMRGLLGMLPDTAPGEEETIVPPARGMADLPSLAEQTAAAGVRIDLRVEGERRDLPPGVDLAAYRIVQESLTNVVKHARTDHGRVVVGYVADALEIEVTDHGTGRDRAGGGAGGGIDGGHGLIGMRERVALHGGEFSAGPLPPRGFRVTARLPAGALAGRLGSACGWSWRTTRRWSEPGSGCWSTRRRTCASRARPGPEPRRWSLSAGSGRTSP